MNQFFDVIILDLEQPATCGKCGARTDWTDNADGSQTHTCLCCGYSFVGEFEDEPQSSLFLRDDN